MTMVHLHGKTKGKKKKGKKERKKVGRGGALDEILIRL